MERSNVLWRQNSCEPRRVALTGKIFIFHTVTGRQYFRLYWNNRGYVLLVSLRTKGRKGGGDKRQAREKVARACFGIVTFQCAFARKSLPVSRRAKKTSNAASAVANASSVHVIRFKTLFSPPLNAYSYFSGTMRNTL